MRGLRTETEELRLRLVQVRPRLILFGTEPVTEGGFREESGLGGRQHGNEHMLSRREFDGFNGLELASRPYYCLDGLQHDKRIRPAWGSSQTVAWPDPPNDMGVQRPVPFQGLPGRPQARVRD